jgi:GntR family histidine utilization transcriptional repressor
MPHDASQSADPRKYVRLAAALSGRIVEGTLRPGEIAPSISALAAEHGGMARQTCAKALHMLEAEGRLLRVRGLGYFISDRGDIATGRAHLPPILRVAELLTRHDDE